MALFSLLCGIKAFDVFHLLLLYQVAKRRVEAPVREVISEHLVIVNKQLERE